MGHWVVSVWFSFSDDPSQEQEEGRKDLLILMEAAAVLTSVDLKLCPVSVSTVCAFEKMLAASGSVLCSWVLS